MKNINNQALIKNSSFIDGQWVGSTRLFDVVNPSTEGVISKIFEVTESQVEQAIVAASKALAKWQNMPTEERAAKLELWQKLIRDNIEDIARIITLEQGKPLAEAKAEIIHSTNYIKLYASLIEEVSKPCSVLSDDDQLAKVYKKPIGVVSAITPWNFPCSMVLRKSGAALAAGCTLVLKPSELTPLTATALIQLSIDAGIPQGVINLVVGSNSQMIGKVLTQHSKVAKVSFTGSTKVGKQLLTQCALGVKRTSMELGGNAPFIVFEDADINKAVDSAIASRFRNSGQTCVCANRFIVQESIADYFIHKLIDRISYLRVLDGFESQSDMGPLINPDAVAKMKSLIKTATKQGAKILYGGELITGKGYFFKPTLLDHVNSNMDIFNQEIFGPILSVTRFENKKQALQLANESNQGLAGYIFTQDNKLIENFSNQLEVGMLGINEVKLSNPNAPFGGVKESGMGREGGRYGIEDYLDYQYVCQTKTPA